MPSRLTLSVMVGPVVPIPLPQAAIDELTNVEVTQTAERGKPGGFRLTFNLSKHSPLHTIFLLTGGAVPPVMRTLIVATINGTPYVLMDGVITKQDVSPGTDASHDTLDITGVDLTAVMGWIDFSGIPYPAMPIEARAALIVAKYALFGIVPLVIPSILFDVPIPTDKIPKHKGTDLAVSERARGTRRLRVLRRPWAAAGDEHRVLRPGDQGGHPAAGAQRQHGRTFQRRAAELLAGHRGEEAAGDVHPGSAVQDSRSRSRSPTSRR